MSEEGHVFGFCLRDENAVEGVFVGRSVFGTGEGFEGEYVCYIES